jgi:hypothetical protein
MTKYWVKVDSLDEIGANKEVVTVKENETLVTVPKDPSARSSYYRDQISSLTLASLKETIRDFVDVYAVSFKEAEVKLPAYVSLEFGSEYDDEGGSYYSLTSFRYYNEDQERYYFDVWVDDDSDFDEVLLEEIGDNFSSSELHDLLDYHHLIKIA